MLSYAVVVQFSKTKQCLTRLILCFESSIVNKLSFQRLIERFHERIVVWIAFATVRWCLL